MLGIHSATDIVKYLGYGKPLIKANKPKGYRLLSFVSSGYYIWSRTGWVQGVCQKYPRIISKQVLHVKHLPSHFRLYNSEGDKLWLTFKQDQIR